MPLHTPLATNIFLPAVGGLIRVIREH